MRLDGVYYSTVLALAATSVRPFLSYSGSVFLSLSLFLSFSALACSVVVCRV